MASARTIVLAVDASQHSKAAFDWYLQNLHRPDDQIIICHIPEAPHLKSFSFKEGLALPVDEWQQAIQAQLEKMKKLQDEYEADLTGKKLKYKVVMKNAKPPGEGIVEVARDEQAQAIVMGSRGLDVVRRTLIGSVSDYVVHHSPVPVVICPKSS